MSVDASEPVSQNEQIVESLFGKLRQFCGNYGREIYLKHTLNRYIQENKSETEIFEDLGYKTIISTDELSSRAKFFLETQGSIHESGQPLNPEGQQRVLRQYENAYEKALQLSRTIDPSLAQIISVGGSIADGTAHLGVYPIGNTYRDSHLSHLMNAQAKRSARHGSYEFISPGNSDIDIMFNLSSIQSGSSVNKIYEEISKMVFDEYGVLVHFLDSRAVEHIKYTQEERQSVSLEDITKAGGLSTYYGEKITNITAE